MKKGQIAVAVAMIAPFFWVIGLSGGQASASNAGGNPKSYSVTVNPTVGAGESGDNNGVFSVVVTNQNPLQNLGSLNMSLPGLDFVLPDAASVSYTLAGYTVSPTPPPTVSVVGGVVEVRGLSMPYNASISFSISADVPCVNESGAWYIVAKQANDFSGVGNGFGLLSTPSVAVGRTCSLQFISNREPADTQVNTPISTVPFTPPANSSQYVEAQLLDDLGNPVNPGDAANPGDQAANTTTAIANLNTPTGPALEQVTTLGGIAAFPNMAVGTANSFSAGGTQSSYVLYGTGTSNSGQIGISSSPLGNGAPSTAFYVWGAGTLCSNNGSKCTVSTGTKVNSGIAGTPNGNVSPTTEEVSQNQQSISCGDSYFHAPVFSNFASTAGAFLNNSVEVTVTINNPVAPASQYQICFQDANYQFFLYSNGGSPVQGALGEPGILATCKQTGGLIPCVNSISKNRQGAVVEILEIPPGDPCVH